MICFKDVGLYLSTHISCPLRPTDEVVTASSVVLLDVDFMLLEVVFVLLDVVFVLLDVVFVLLDVVFVLLDVVFVLLDVVFVLLDVVFVLLDVVFVLLDVVLTALVSSQLCPLPGRVLISSSNSSSFNILVPTSLAFAILLCPGSLPTTR
jgi:hypothetical protein